VSGAIAKAFSQQLSERIGPLRRLEGSRSLFEALGGSARFYLRYSRVHEDGRTFFGLRSEDLKALEGRLSYICFLWDNQQEPLLVPFSEYEEVFRSLTAASDGQYKVQIYLEREGTELYIARAGRFNVDAHYGWTALDGIKGSTDSHPIPQLAHNQVQTLLGAIGTLKGFDIWIPQNDRDSLDWSIANRFRVAQRLPGGFDQVTSIIREIDVLWLTRGSGQVGALYEVEHTTTIYSGLLRFNDILLAKPDTKSRFSVVANEERRQVFVRQLNRPTFLASGLRSLCTFMTYDNIFSWHERIKVGTGEGA